MKVDAKKILFLSATRADFGKIKPLIQRVKDSGEFEYSLFVTGMHMLSRYGSTVNEIRKAGFENLFAYINQDGAVNSQMDLVLGNTVIGLGHYVREYRPDLIVVHGDRAETLAGAIVGALNNILVAHIEGGEVSGTIDELIRHAVSKLSHLHFVSNEQAHDRLIQMGEAEESVFVIGSPDLDVMLSGNLPSLSEVRRKYEIDFPDYGILLYHPVTTEPHLLKQNINAVLDGLDGSGWNFVAIYPNNDPGAEVILEAFGRFQGNSRVRLIPSMRFEYFLTLMKNAQAVVGNSSAGVREAPAYGVPTINIGGRQQNRFRYESILDIPEDKAFIMAALRNLPTAITPSMHFGDGRSSERFASKLRSPGFWSTPRQKQFRDLSWEVASGLVSSRTAIARQA
jgi:UDP-N-acetylglucosamine 2-epimerase (hydrolysing)